ncbi:MAG TPA: homocysteine biosynthesis protein [Spirochaetota bacterium]|nr:homocysteine biosynthesis protein [Spirochaetota bacterium]HPF05202.1 homocysteine biosynthesis protein [Spirochaetota bacterium]HPJ41901.1 homocysteine biosynthesis protein [Spirochaetota bacterium]HPR38230.1 homocysteine biosynthesis protein [Spirochaetota bacterium]HRX47954.1 homocysteine biosynthesis protein [Spirochaetota bacterium]
MNSIEIKKSYEEINDRIKKGKAVVVTAEEMPEIVKTEGVKKAFEKVDVVTTGTFGVMCSSGAFLNFGHTKPRMRASKVWLNDVEAYGGIAAVDCYLGATQVKDDDPLNMVHPGSFSYGGGHVIEDLIAGRHVKLKTKSYGTDCYPLKEFEKTITINDLRNALLYNPRNAYQNYNVAINLSKKIKYTYMGILKPDMGNITYSSAGQLSPLLNDPYYWTIGTGTKIFLGGAAGAVTWHGTQHAPDSMRDENGMVREGAGTIAVCGDMKEMNTEYIRGASLTGYGTSLMVGIGIPIPILNEDLAFFTGLSDRDIKAQLIDYGIDYPDGNPVSLKEVTYAELKSGQVEFRGRNIPSSPLSSYPKAKKIANVLREWIENGFTVGVPQLQAPTIPYVKNR